MNKCQLILDRAQMTDRGSVPVSGEPVIFFGYSQDHLQLIDSCTNEKFSPVQVRTQTNRIPELPAKLQTALLKNALFPAPAYCFDILGGEYRLLSFMRFLSFFESWKPSSLRSNVSIQKKIATQTFLRMM